MEQLQFKAGQIWSYKARLEDKNSKLSIWKIEEEADGSAIAHISILDVVDPNTRKMVSIEHAPISLDALSNSVLQLLSDDQPVMDASEGYQMYLKDAAGSFFTKPVSFIVESVFQVLPKRGVQ